MVFQIPEDEGPCPALEWEDGRTACGILRRPAHYLSLNWGDADEREKMRSFILPTAEKILAIGQGCGMPDDEDEALKAKEASK